MHDGTARFKEHHGNNFAPKNRTLYYSLNYKKLEELIRENESGREASGKPVRATVKQVSNGSNNESIRFTEEVKQFCPSSENQFCSTIQIYTKNTSIENNSKENTHPTLPCESNNSNSINQEKDCINTSELSSTSEKPKNPDSILKEIEIGISSADVEYKINQNISTTPDVGSGSFAKFSSAVDKPLEAEKSPSFCGDSAIPKPKLKIEKETKLKRNKQAPWKDEGQFKRFYRALIQALPIVANSHSPQGLAQTIIKQLRCGIPHSYWDDFVNNLPIGTSTKPEWEVEPGVPYPMFFEYLTEKLKAGNNSTSEEQTRNEVFRILGKPRQAKAFWGQFKRSVVNVSQKVESDRALGVTNPNTPVWTRERIEPSLSEASEAGKKIMAINSTTSNAIAANTENARIEKPPSPSKKLTEEENPQLKRYSGNNVSPTSDPWSDDGKPQPSMKEMLTSLLGDRNLKGFVKAMPKAHLDTASHISRHDGETEFRDETEAANLSKLNRKTHIAQMSVKEINQLLTDPIMRKELTPQIIFNDKFEIITDNLGEVLAVKINSEYQKNGGF